MTHTLHMRARRKTWGAANSHMRNISANVCVPTPVVASDETAEALSEATTHHQQHSPLSWRWSLAKRDLEAAAASPAKAGGGSGFLHRHTR